MECSLQIINQPMCLCPKTGPLSLRRFYKLCASGRQQINSKSGSIIQEASVALPATRLINHRSQGTSLDTKWSPWQLHFHCFALSDPLRPGPRIASFLFRVRVCSSQNSKSFSLLLFADSQTSKLQLHPLAHVTRRCHRRRQEKCPECESMGAIKFQEAELNVRRVNK